jgi:hypothetical protein
MPFDGDGKEFIWMNAEMVNDPAIRNLSAEEFGRLFREALAGKKNVFSRHIRHDPNPNLD